MISFIKQFVLYPYRTGAVISSSKSLAELITSVSNLSKAKAVVELGPGDGAFTEEILKKKPRRTKFFAIEINPHFASVVKRKFPKVKVYRGSAAKIKKYLKKHRASHCDCIISGLPWASFDRKKQARLLKPIRESLGPKGEFLTFAYIHNKIWQPGVTFSRLLEKSFSRVRKTRIVWDNFPPAFVYHCRK